MNTNAKTIGLLLVLCFTTVGSPVMAQTPAAQQIGTDAKKQSSEFLRRARLAMKGGNLELAERFITESEKLGPEANSFLSRFSDSAAKARKDLNKLKAANPVPAQAGQVPQQLLPKVIQNNVVQLPSQNQAAVQARSVMAQAKAAFDRGELKLSETLVKQASAFQAPDAAFSGGDTPWELGMKIQKQYRLTGVAQASASNPTQQQIDPAVFNPNADNSYVRTASAEDSVLPPTNALAQQVQTLNPLLQQPAPVTLQGQSIPGTSITLPGATIQPGSNFVPGPATAAPSSVLSPAPPATTFQSQPSPVPATAGSPVAQGQPQNYGAPTPFNSAPTQTLPTQTFISQPYQNYNSPQNGITSVPGATSYGISPDELIKLGEQKLRDRELEEARDLFRQAYAMKDQLDVSTRQRLQDHLQLVGTEISTKGSQATAKEREEASRLSRLLADVSREQMAINRELKANPKDAWEQLKALRQRLDDADLPDDTRRRWLTKLDRDAAAMEKYIETNRAQIEIDERNRDVLEMVNRERRIRVEVQNNLATSVEEFNTLMDQQRYSEAYVLARQAREIAPNNEVTESMIWKSRFAERMYVNMNLRDRRDRMFEYSNDPNELGVPDAYTLSNPIAFPEKWDDLMKRRDSLMADGGSRYNEAEQAIERALRKKVQVQFDEAPIGEVIETLGRMTGVNVFVDTEGLAAEGVTTDTPVTMNLSQEISLRSVLNLILGQYRLGYVIQDEVLRITSESARAGDTRTIPYYVGDLVIPIPNFMPGHNNGLAGALAQAYSALGYGPGGFAQNRSQNSPLVIADNTGQQQQQNVGSPLALAQMGSSTPIPGMPNAPQPPGVGGMGGASGADFDSLINLITSTVEPDSWDDVGGPGTVQSFDGNLSLVVSNTQEVHDAIVELLEQLRRLQDLQVTIEVRFVTLQDNFFERIGVDFDFDINDNTGLTDQDLAADTFQEDGSDITIGLDPSGNPTVDLDLSFNQEHFGAALPQFGGFTPGIASSFGFAILSDIEAFFLIEAIQGDSRTNVMQAPKVTLFNGQFASINDTQNRPFVTSVVPVVGDFAVAQQPVIMVLAEGTQLSVQAVVSSDRRFVRLTMLPMFSQIGDVDTFTFEGRTRSTTGSSTETDPDSNTTTNNRNDDVFTEGTTVQLPNFATTSVSTTVSVPDGGTVLMGGIKRLAEGRTERGMPILSKLPYINRLFKNVGTGRETQTLMMMVTPRIIIQEEEEERLLGSGGP